MTKLFEGSTATVSMKNLVLDPERKKKGLYWNRAWKLVEGCTKISPGCENCWSERETAMRAGQENRKIRDRARAVINSKGEFDRIIVRKDNLKLPLKTRKAEVFAVWNDLFHHMVPMTFIIEALDAMYATRDRHRFLVLTKRPRIMAAALKMLVKLNDKPLPENIWFGLTACNQEELDTGLPSLLDIPAKRFISFEPLLGPVSLRQACIACASHQEAHCPGSPDWCVHAPNIDQVLVGGESGAGARPMHPRWAKDLRDECQTAGIPFFFKQWGEWAPCNDFKRLGIKKPWPVEQVGHATLSGEEMMTRCGRAQAGRELDGYVYDRLVWE